jgi:hypothetical protein
MQDISRGLNILDGQPFVARLCVQLRLARECCEGFRVIGTSADAFLEDGRIRRHATQSIVDNQALPFPTRDETPPNIIQLVCETFMLSSP